MQLKYRPEIDGLRALAVLPVIFFHAGFSIFSGGFIGVDVFFVISGYLITKIIYSEVSSGTFSLLRFYERRARRILPALCCVVFVSTIFSWLIMTPRDLQDYAKSLIGVGLFISNLVFWRSNDYFETASELRPLLHTWSLSVEEQFYLFFPLLLLVFRFLSRPRILSLILGLLSASFIFAISSTYSGTQITQSFSFYSLPTRAWELFFGAILVFCSGAGTKHSVLKKILSSLGLLFVLLPMFFLPRNILWPSYLTILPVMGTALVIHFSDTNTFAYRLLSRKELVGVGLISYSLYLWHQPVYAFARYLMPINRLDLHFLILALIFLLAWLTWLWIENPARHSLHWSRARILSCSLGLLASFCILGVASYFAPKQFEKRLAKELIRSDVVYLSSTDERIFSAERLRQEDKQFDLAIIGSSRHLQLGSGETRQNSINLSVSGGSIEDIVALTFLTFQYQKPRELWLGADPWSLNLLSAQDRWHSIFHLYLSGLEAIGVKTAGIKVPNLSISRTPIFEALFFPLHWIYSTFNRSRIGATNETPELVAKKRRDGFHIYDTTYRSRSQAEIEARFAENLFYIKGSQFEMSEDHVMTMRSMLRFYKNKATTKLVLSPFHPRLYQLMLLQFPEIEKVEQMWRNIAEDENIDIIGSYDPNKVACSISEFYDGLHPREECMKKVVESPRR